MQFFSNVFLLQKAQDRCSDLTCRRRATSLA